MSGSLKIGDDVQAETRKIVGKRDFTQLTGNANYPDTLSGTVMGKGKGQKWEVRWRLSDQQTLNSEHGARVFAKKIRASVQKSAIRQIASDNSDMSISYDLCKMDGGESEDDGNDVPEEEEEAADGEGGNLMAH